MPPKATTPTNAGATVVANTGTAAPRTWRPTLQQVQQTQLTRVEIVRILNDPNLAQLIKNCFVRVLLEIETDREDYRAFAIKEVTRGRPYRGFSSDPNVSTDVHIELHLPQRLRGINGVSFQLNSVSNSHITQAEYDVWLQSPLIDGDEADLDERKVRLRGHPALHRTHSSSSSGQASRPQPQAAQDTSANGGNNAATLQPNSTIAVGARPSANEPLNSTRGVPDDISPEHARRVVMEELREKNAIFVNPAFAEHKTSLLKTAERDLQDYLEKVREAITSLRQTCVACMDRPPSVITMPCKHKVLCRLCATQVSSCPVCRETAVELFEPIEP